MYIYVINQYMYVIKTRNNRPFYRVCVCACVRACVRACVCVCVFLNNNKIYIYRINHHDTVRKSEQANEQKEIKYQRQQQSSFAEVLMGELPTNQNEKCQH